jgi:hypothetical protein
MNDPVLAGLPIVGMLACLFIGFHFIAFSKSRSAEQIGYLFFAGGVAWVITTGVILWPMLGSAGHAWWAAWPHVLVIGHLFAVSTTIG